LKTASVFAGSCQRSHCVSCGALSGAEAGRPRGGAPGNTGRAGSSGAYESGVVGEDHGLDAVAGVDLGEDAADVGFDGGLGEVDAFGAVGGRLGELPPQQVDGFLGLGARAV